MLKSRKILIVEDRGDLRELLGEALVLMGWEAILAESRREALDKIECEIPNVIFLSLRMTFMDGVKLAVTLKAHPVYKNIPILAAGASCSGLTRQRCLALGFDEFIAKPFALPELERRLEGMLSADRRRAIRATYASSLEFSPRHSIPKSAGHRKVA